MADSKRLKIETPTTEDMARIHEVLHTIGGQHVVWGAVDTFNVWVAETRLSAERESAKRLLVATWVLAAATVGLVLATIGLVVVALSE